MDSPHENMQSLPKDAEALRALVLTTFAERDAAVTERDVIAAVRRLVLVANDDLIAGILNRNGLVTGHGNRWTRERLTSLRSQSPHPGVQTCRGRDRAVAQCQQGCAAS
jgi:hypothetical protein